MAIGGPGAAWCPSAGQCAGSSPERWGHVCHHQSSLRGSALSLLSGRRRCGPPDLSAPTVAALIVAGGTSWAAGLRPGCTGSRGASGEQHAHPTPLGQSCCHLLWAEPCQSPCALTPRRGAPPPPPAGGAPHPHAPSSRAGCPVGRGAALCRWGQAPCPGPRGSGAPPGGMGGRCPSRGPGSGVGGSGEPHPGARGWGAPRGGSGEPRPGVQGWDAPGGV